MVKIPVCVLVGRVPAILGARRLSRHDLGIKCDRYRPDLAQQDRRQLVVLKLIADQSSLPNHPAVPDLSQYRDLDPIFYLSTNSNDAVSRDPELECAKREWQLKDTIGIILGLRE